MKINQFIKNRDGKIDFAIFPEIKHRLRTFPRAPVRLQIGNDRWGAKHIAKAHSKELKELTVVEFVSAIVRAGTPIHCEFESMNTEQKTLAINVRVGRAVLGYKEIRGSCFYTVITAFVGRQAKGEKIGVLK
jgi:hypothetical protein